MDKTGRFRHNSANTSDLASPSQPAPEAVSLSTCGGAVLAEIAAIQPPGIVLAWCYHGTTMVPRWCTEGSDGVFTAGQERGGWGWNRLPLAGRLGRSGIRHRYRDEWVAVPGCAHTLPPRHALGRCLGVACRID